MANSIMNTVYNQYLTTYAPKKNVTRYDAHKRSELRSIYNSMAKVNKDAPLYLLESTAESRQYMVDLKENSRELHNTILASLGNTQEKDFHTKAAYSSNENIATAKYIQHDDAQTAFLSGSILPSSISLEDDLNTSADSADSSDLNTAANSANASDSSIASETTPSFQIEVQSLATPQTNLGIYLKSDEEVALDNGSYSFDLTVNGQGYEFQYAVQEDDTNIDLQNRIARLINNSKVGLNATVLEDEAGNSSLQVASNMTGYRLGQTEQTFSITDDTTSKLSGTVSYLGLDYMATPASNAHFTVNGEEGFSSSNKFLLENEFEITLTGISSSAGESTTIGTKPDTQAVTQNITNLIQGYNQFIQSMDSYQVSQSKSRNLSQEMVDIADYYKEDMTSLGITMNEEGQLSVDSDTLNDRVAEGSAKDLYQSVQNFSKSLLRKSDQVSLNPVSYLNKTVVAYKNPGHSQQSPYVVSAYAGLLFNSYC